MASSYPCHLVYDRVADHLKENTHTKKYTKIKCDFYEINALINLILSNYFKIYQIFLQ